MKKKGDLVINHGKRLGDAGKDIYLTFKTLSTTQPLLKSGGDGIKGRQDGARDKE